MAAVTSADLAERIGKPDSPAIQKAFATATQLLTDALAGAFREMPEDVHNECLLSVGYAVWDRKKSSFGVGQMTTMEGQVPVRSPRDPLASVRSIIGNYVLDLA